jgi:hypothetical protein
VNPACWPRKKGESSDRKNPEGVAAQNRVRTLPDQGFFVYIRSCGPLKAFNDKSGVPSDVEMVK